MERRRTRNLIIAGLGILLLIGIGAARSGVSGEDSALQVFDTGGSGEEQAVEGEGEGVDDFASVDEDSADNRVRVERQASSGISVSSASSSSSGQEFSDGRGVTTMGGSGASGGGSAGDGDTSVSADAQSSVPLPPLRDSERIIKDGRLEVEVPKGGFDRAFQAVIQLADRVGGQVVSSQSSRDEERASGEVTIRVPAQQFDKLLASTGGIGTIEHREITSQDVSGEFVDLQARVRHLQAQEQFYLGLLGKARVVGDAIAINQHLSTVQAEMEQVQGRLRLLDERSTYSRLTISLYERGVTPLLTDRMPEQQGALARAWHEAVTALQETVGALLVGAFTLAPLLLLALLGWGLWRRLRPRPAAPQDPRPAVEEEAGPLPVG